MPARWPIWPYEVAGEYTRAEKTDSQTEIGRISNPSDSPLTTDTRTMPASKNSNCIIAQVCVQGNWRAGASPSPERRDAREGTGQHIPHDVNHAHLDQAHDETG